MGLGLLLRVWTKCEVHVGDISQISMTLLVGNPDFVQHRIVRNLLESPVDLVRAQSRRFPHGHEMCCHPCLHDHLLAEGRFHIVHNTGAEGRAATE